MRNINEDLLSKGTKMQDKFPENMPKNVEHTDDPHNKWEFLVYLDDHEYEFTIDHGRFDNSMDVIIETKYPGITVIFSFIGPSEYLLEMKKDGSRFTGEDSSRELSRTANLGVLDPLAYFKTCLKNCEKKLASANKGKMNRRTGEYERNYSDIMFYEKKVARYKKYIEMIQ